MKYKGNTFMWNMNPAKSDSERDIKIELTQQVKAPSRDHHNVSSHKNGKMTNSEDKLQSDKSRIGFLNQCKLELSAEVIRWKEENLKLRKESESIVKKMKEQQCQISKLMKQNHNLETSLYHSWEENKRLRMRTLAIGEENQILLEKLSKSRFHSYPWSEYINKQCNLSYNECGNTEDIIEDEQSWEEVSKKLFQKMEEEIKEMKQFSFSLSTHEKCTEHENSKASEEHISEEPSESTVNVEATREVDKLVQMNDSLKRQLVLQNQKLNFLLNQISKEMEAKQVLPHDATTSNVLSHKKIGQDSDSAPNLVDNGKLARPSDETCRAYFTQQLSNNNKMPEDKSPGSSVKVNNSISNTKANNNELPAQSSTGGSHTTTSHISSRQKKIPVATKSTVQSTKQQLKSETMPNKQKTCPFCQGIFAQASDKEFEAHVIEHLERGSASLLEQYEVV